MGHRRFAIHDSWDGETVRRLARVAAAEINIGLRLIERAEAMARAGTKETAGVRRTVFSRAEVEVAAGVVVFVCEEDHPGKLYTQAWCFPADELTGRETARGGQR